MKRILFALSLLFVILFSCYYDSEENLYPVISSVCDTTSVTYSLSIVPLIRNNCFSCHSNANASTDGGNVHLEDYADVNSNKTVLLSAIKHSPGVSPMPKGGAKLNNCLIRMVELWINMGAPNN